MNLDKAAKTTLNEAVVSVIEAELKSLFDAGVVEAVEALNEKFLKSNAANFSCLVEAAKVVYELNPSTNQKKALDMFTNVDPKSFKEGSFNIQVKHVRFYKWWMID